MKSEIKSINISWAQHYDSFLPPRAYDLLGECVCTCVYGMSVHVCVGGGR
jgi:hypothetical protein